MDFPDLLWDASLIWTALQIHLSLTGKAGQMAIDFVADAANQVVNFQPAGGKPQSVKADCAQSTLNNYKAYWCTAVMSGLAPNTNVSYTVGTPGSTTPAFEYTNEPSARPPVFAVYADFGLMNDESLKALQADAKAGGFDVVIHAGDWVGCGWGERAQAERVSRQVHFGSSKPALYCPHY
jgi:hypothetical protein